MNEKLRQFINDETLSSAVFNVLMEEFIRPRRIPDTNYLAASRIAIDQLQEAWKVLKNYKNEKSKEGLTIKNIGL